MPIIIIFTEKKKFLKVVLSLVRFQYHQPIILLLLNSGSATVKNFMSLKVLQLIKQNGPILHYPLALSMISCTQIVQDAALLEEVVEELSP